jgi:hypothetical protein
MVFPGEFPSGWKSVESSGSKSLVFLVSLRTFFMRVLIISGCENPGKRVFDFFPE